MGRLLPIRRSTGKASEMSDASLVAACAAGETAALAALFDRYHRDLHRFLVRLGGVDDHAVDDLIQDTFLQAFESARRFRGDAAVRTWLMGIATNLARRYVRSDVRRKSRDATFAALTAQPTTATGPARTAEQHEIWARLRAAMAELPHELRAAYLICDVEGARGVDAARALGLRQGTLYRRLHEARKRLRSALQEEP